jgi:steroid delta-isomerase-like uncharacterized protein
MTSEPNPRSEVERNKAVVRRVFDEIANRGSFEVIPEIYSPEVVDHDPWPGSRDGLQGIEDSIASLREAFPDLHVTIEDMSADGDFVVVHNTWHGTQTGSLLGLPPTGRRVAFKGIVLWRLEDGKIVERWGMLDTGGMLAQTGKRVAMGSAGPRRAIRAGRTDGRRRRRTSEPAARFLEVRPVNRDKVESWRALYGEMEGTRKEETKESRRALGVSRELVWGHPFGADYYSVHYWELEDLAGFYERTAHSDAPIDRWYRDRWQEIAGLDLAASSASPPAEKTFEWADREALREADSFVSIVFLQPVIAPDELREFTRLLGGERRTDYEESRRRHGILREIAFEQRLPDDVHVQAVYADLLSSEAFRSLAESAHPFDVWYRERVLVQHGVDLAELKDLPCELVFEWPPARALAGL